MSDTPTLCPTPQDIASMCEDPTSITEVGLDGVRRSVFSYLPSDPLNRLLLQLAVALAALRLALLPRTPPGFFVDEAGAAANVKSMLAHGVNASGRAWPFYSDNVAGGFTAPTYLYPATLWARFFGTSETALRAFSQVTTMLAIVALAAGAALWLDRRFGLLVAVTALAMPWGWLQGSLAWDPAMIPLFACLAFLAFSVLLFSVATRHRAVAAVVLPLSFLAMAYTYPPCRFGAPILFCLCYAMLLRRRAITLHSFGLSVLAAVVVAAPLLQFMVEPAARARSVALSVFSQGAGFRDGAAAFARNLEHLMGPTFLFVHGDPNLRQSTGHQGMLGLAAAIPLVVALISGTVLLVRRMRGGQSEEPLTLTLFAVVAVVAGLASSALTNEGQPHSLRATAAWPFAALLVALGWYWLLVHGRQMLVAGAAVLFVYGTFAYALDLQGGYLKRSGASFDVGIREQIAGGGADWYPQPALSYYRSS